VTLRRAAVLFVPLIALEAAAASCSATSGMPPVGGDQDCGSVDATEEVEVKAPPKTCADYGGKCRGGGDCPVQVTGIALCEGDQICCAGFDAS
jgi:hypothetical protein